MSKRFNLREFQQSVLDRLQAQVAAAAIVFPHWVCRWARDFWLVDMSDINEVLPPPALTSCH